MNRNKFLIIKTKFDTVKNNVIMFDKSQTRQFS